MRGIGRAAMVVALALVVAACGGSPTARGTPPAPASTSSATLSPSTSPKHVDPARAVVDAAFAAMAETTFRYDVEVRSADPDDRRPPVVGHGQVSFGDPVQFRFETAGTSEVIYDGERGFVRGRDTAYLPAETWVVFDLGPGVAQPVRDAFMRTYGNAALVLVAPMGATRARPAGNEVVRGAASRRYVADVDISTAREQLPDAVRVALDAQLAAFEGRGTPPTHELEVWVDDIGRLIRTRYEHEAAPGETIVVTYDFTDFGASMDAAPPEGAEVLTVAEARERYEASLESPSPSP